MKTRSVLVALGGLATLAVSQPVDVNPDVAVRTSRMVRYCSGAGFTGNCGEDADVNLRVCESAGTMGMTDGFKSVLIFDHFQCYLYSDADCGGQINRYQPGSYPNVGIYTKSFKCMTE